MSTRTSGHTPGPWSARAGQPEITATSRRGYDGVVAMVGRDFWADRDANARLIAEAPAMLALLEALVAHYTRLIYSSPAEAFKMRDDAETARALLARVERTDAP